MSNDIAPVLQLRSLLALDQAVELLAGATLDDVLELADQAEKVRALTRGVKGAETAYANAYTVRELATYQLGQITAAMPKSKPGRKATKVFPAAQGPELITSAPGEKTKGDQLAEAGVSWKQAARAERVAQIPADEFRARVAAGRERILGGKAAKDTAATTAASDYSSDEWSTPEKYIVAVREVFGGSIELDPACNAFAANVVRPERFHTKADSGLNKQWVARNAFVNPPYSRMLVLAFVDKAIAEYEAKRCGEIIVLTNSSTETGWYQRLVAASSALCLPSERIGFELQGRAVEDNRNAQTFFYLGENLEAFHRVFSKLGSVLVPLRGFA